MPEHDRDRWDRRWRERAAAGDLVTAPSSFLVGAAAHLPARGRAVDLAGGAGRHARWLAARGLDVTLVDISEAALALAGPGLHCVCADLEVDAPPAGPWDVALIFHYLHRPLLARIPALLAPAGLLLFCQPTRRNLERHEHPSAAYLLAEGELPGLIGDLQVLEYREDWSDEGRHEARLIARR
jgi:SAM-dependent methyltransferase